VIGAEEAIFTDIFRLEKTHEMNERTNTGWGGVGGEGGGGGGGTKEKERRKEGRK
jgi:hypothetical protein